MICAKQSQFPPRRHEGQRLGGKGVMVNQAFNRPRQNKANWPKRGTGAVSRLPIADWRQTCNGTPLAGGRAGAQLYEQTQLGGANRARQTQSSPPRRPRYPIIPLFHRCSVPVRCVSCKTNPISGGRQGRCHRRAGPCETKPICPAVPGVAWGPGAWDAVQTKPISARATRRASALRERSYGE